MQHSSLHCFHHQRNNQMMLFKSYPQQIHPQIMHNSVKIDCDRPFYKRDENLIKNISVINNNTKNSTTAASELCSLDTEHSTKYFTLQQLKRKFDDELQQDLSNSKQPQLQSVGNISLLSSSEKRQLLACSCLSDEVSGEEVSRGGGASILRQSCLQEFLPNPYLPVSTSAFSFTSPHFNDEKFDNENRKSCGNKKCVNSTESLIKHNNLCNYCFNPNLNGTINNNNNNNNKNLNSDKIIKRNNNTNDIIGKNLIGNINNNNNFSTKNYLSVSDRPSSNKAFPLPNTNPDVISTNKFFLPYKSLPQSNQQRNLITVRKNSILSDNDAEEEGKNVFEKIVQV